MRAKPRIQVRSLMYGVLIASIIMWVVRIPYWPVAVILASPLMLGGVVLFIALRPKLTRAALGLACVPLLWIGSGYATFSYSALRFGHWLSSNDKPHLDSIYLLLLILTATCAIATIPAGVASLLVPWSLLHGSGDETSEKTKTRRLAIAALIASWALLFVLLGLDLGGAMSWLLELFRLR